MLRHVARVVALLAVIGTVCARAQEGAPPEAVVLDTLSVWRFHSQLSGPVLDTGQPAPMSCRWMAYQTPAAPPRWMAPDSRK